MPLPKALVESIAVLRDAFNGLARDQDFLQLHNKNRRNFTPDEG